MTCYADTFANIKPGTLGKAFTVALLLSAGVQRAEAAVLAAVGQLDPDQVCDDEFIGACVKHATMPQTRSTDRLEPVENAPLPIELKRILLLPTYLRHSFVLRVLLKDS